MKIIYLIYAILVKGISVIRVFSESGVVYAAHDKPQDGYGSHSGSWATGLTPQEAAWNLKRLTHKQDTRKYCRPKKIDD
jgi:hypothetical protein